MAAPSRRLVVPIEGNPPASLHPSTSTSRSGIRHPWAVWSLLLAWFFGNVPAGAALGALAWAGGARHFNHQAQLREEVAGLLGHQRPAAAVRHRLAGQATLPLPLPSPAPVEKRFEAYFTAGLAWAVILVRDLEHQPRTVSRPNRERTEPLLEPPRVFAAV